MINFKTDTVIYSSKDTGTAVFRDNNTIGYQFINTGNCAVYLNNYLLQPQTTWKTFETGYSDQTVYRMNFQDSFSSCAVINSELTVIIYNKI